MAKTVAGSPLDNDERGQINTGLVWGIVTMLVAVAIGGLIYSQISGELGDQVEDNSIGDNVKQETDDGANTVFPLLVLVVIVGVFVALIGVLKQM
jgi:amino acid permease